MSRAVAVLVFALALSACATGAIYGPGPRGGPQPGAERGGAGAELPGDAGLPDAGRPDAGRPDAGLPDVPRQGASATAALVVQSRQERDTGNLGGAAATIERALSIAPEDAALWMELADLRLAQGDWEQAEEMARKALTLTAEDTEVAVRARRLLAQ